MVKILLLLDWLIKVMMFGLIAPEEPNILKSIRSLMLRIASFNFQRSKLNLRSISISHSMKWVCMSNQLYGISFLKKQGLRKLAIYVIAWVFLA